VLDGAFDAFCAAVAAGDRGAALGVVTPELARLSVEVGARRDTAGAYWLEGIGHHLYAGDTALHVAAAGYAAALVSALVTVGADVGARNRMGAAALHYAADGQPGSARWDPAVQAETVTALLGAGADPDAVDERGVTALHRAVRCRCAAAVAALLAGGADPARPNGNGSTALDLATRTTGRGGSGTPEARAQQQEILAMLAR
jgi:hypothetical protein